MCYVVMSVFEIDFRWLLFYESTNLTRINFTNVFKDLVKIRAKRNSVKEHEKLIKDWRKACKLIVKSALKGKLHSTKKKGKLQEI